MRGIHRLIYTLSYKCIIDIYIYFSPLFLKPYRYANGSCQYVSTGKLEKIVQPTLEFVDENITQINEKVKTSPR